MLCIVATDSGASAEHVAVDEVLSRFVLFLGSVMAKLSFSFNILVSFLQCSPHIELRATSSNELDSIAASRLDKLKLTGLNFNELTTIILALLMASPKTAPIVLISLLMLYSIATCYYLCCCSLTHLVQVKR